MFMKYKKFALSFWDEVADTYGVNCAIAEGSPFDCYVIDDNANIVIGNDLSQEKVTPS